MACSSALGFAEGVFNVALGRRPADEDEPAVELDGDALAFDATGVDQVVFMLAPNPGEPPRPLARIASGGEMSRVALAIKQVLAEADDTPTLVFDEVDTGIGGRSADPIGRSLWALARRHQVLCVTHLPQIAAHADAHFRIEKLERDGRTVTEVGCSTRAGGSTSSPRCSAAAPGRPRRRRAELLDRARHAGEPRAPHRADVPAATALDRAIDDFLTYLRVERGLSRGDDPRLPVRPRGLRRGAGRRRRAGTAPRTPRSATSPRGRAAAGRTTRAWHRPRCAVARRASAASTGSPTARG